MEKRPNQKARKTSKKRTPEVISFRRQFNPKYRPYPGEYNDMPSQTRPDMSLTVKELLINHSRGIHSDVKQYEGQYFDTEIPRIDDITDLVQHKKDLEEFQKQLKEDVEKETKDIKKKKTATEAQRAVKIESDKQKVASPPKDQENSPKQSEEDNSTTQ